MHKSGSFVVPDAFAAATIAREGEAGRRWIEALPRQVAPLSRRWQLAIGGAPMHGYLGVVIPVQRDGERCVLKVSWIEASTQHEAAALAAWQGDGAVQLLASDPAAGAMLLERLDARRPLAGVAIAPSKIVTS